MMKALEGGGVEVAALHNHLIGESPRILYIHMGGHGDHYRGESYGGWRNECLSKSLKQV